MRRPATIDPAARRHVAGGRLFRLILALSSGTPGWRSRGGASLNFPLWAPPRRAARDDAMVARAAEAGTGGRDAAPPERSAGAGADASIRQPRARRKAVSSVHAGPTYPPLDVGSLLVL